MSMAATGSELSPVPNAPGSAASFPFVAVRTGQLPVERAMSAPNEACPCGR